MEKKHTDFYSEVAKTMFGPNYTRDERRRIKRLVYYRLYGGQAKCIISHTQSLLYLLQN